MHMDMDMDMACLQLGSLQTIAEMLPIVSRMLHGHSVEGSEWPLMNELVSRSKLTQLMLELHFPKHQSLFDFYALMQRQGFTLMGQEAVRYNNGGKRENDWFSAHGTALRKAGLHPRPPVRWQHVLYTNGTFCGNPLGEFHFYRSGAIEPVLWRYTSEAYQKRNQ